MNEQQRIIRCLKGKVRNQSEKARQKEFEGSRDSVAYI
jgi:hypothetical protein